MFKPSLVLVALMLVTGCGGADDDRPPMPNTVGVDAAEGEDPAEQPAANTDKRSKRHVCEDGEDRTCKVYLPSQGGVENCFVGVETCIDGRWSDCYDPDHPFRRLSEG
jgi:hypothetical protein